MPMDANAFATLTADLERFAGIADGAEIASVMTEAAQPILEQMRQNASSNPRPRSGALRGAISIGPVTRKNGGIAVTIGVHRRDWSGEDYYPAWVEYGHGGPHPAPAHPYIRPAFDARADEAYETLRRLIAQAIQQ